jgi:hypothetical protein
LIRGEATDDLESLDGLVLAKFKLFESSLHLMEEADKSLADGFRAVMRQTDSDEREVILRRKRSKGATKYLNNKVLRAFKKLASIPQVYEEFEKLQTRGVSSHTAKPKDVDVLDDQLILTRKIVKNDKRSRAVQSLSAFQQIEDAFREVLPRLAGASVLLKT